MPQFRWILIMSVRVFEGWGNGRESVAVRFFVQHDLLPRANFIQTVIT